MDLPAVLRVFSAQCNQRNDEAMMASISREAHLLLDELMLHAKGGFRMVPMEVVKEVADRVTAALEVAPDKSVAARRDLITSLRRQRMEFERTRETYDHGVKLIQEFEHFLAESGMNEERCTELRRERSLVQDYESARRWVKRHKAGSVVNVQRQSHATFLEKFQVAIQPTQVAVANESGEEPTDRRVSVLEDRASSVKSEKAERIYVAGLTATDRRDKIRLFKAAIHEERVWAKENKRAKRKSNA